MQRGPVARSPGARQRPLLATKGMELAKQPWSPGPVLMQSGVARRVQAQLKHDPLLLMFDATVKEELATFSTQRKREAGLRHYTSPGAIGEATMMLSLRRQMVKVQRTERREAVAELLYLMACSRFKLIDVQLLQSMRPHMVGKQLTIQAEGRQWGLTDIYSLEALELVRDHLLRMLDSSRLAKREAGAMRLALFQAGQTYAMSMLFGYYLRRMDARYQMDKLIGALGKPVAAPKPPPAEEEPTTRHRRPVPDWMDPHWTKGEVRVEKALADYIKGFGREELQKIRTVASAEAQAAMEAQVYALFGNLKALKLQMLGVVGRVSSNEELAEKIRGAIDSEQVDSIRLTGEDFRRLVLEAVAFGSLLCDSEMEANTVYELTGPPSGTVNEGGPRGFGGALGR